MTDSVAEAQELMRVGQNKSRPEENPKTGSHKPRTKILPVLQKLKNRFMLFASSVIVSNHSGVFLEKTPTQGAQFSAQNCLCFACFQPDHKFRKRF